MQNNISKNNNLKPEVLLIPVSCSLSSRKQDSSNYPDAWLTSPMPIYWRLYGNHKNFYK